MLTCTSISCCIAAMLRFFCAIASSVCRSCDSMAAISALVVPESADSCVTADTCTAGAKAAVHHQGAAPGGAPLQPPQPHFSTGRMNRVMYEKGRDTEP